MAKRILVLNASPRKNGNTAALADALVQGAQQAGHSATILNVDSMKINPCAGCYGCMAKKGNPCVQSDDMQQVYDELQKADVVVFASPLYWWHFTAQMKIVIDRIFGLAAANKMRLPKKETVLLVAAQDESEQNFAQIVPYYQTSLTRNLGWEDKGMLLAGGVTMPGDMEKTPFLEKAKALGASL